MTESVRPALEAALLRELAERYRWENRSALRQPARAAGVALSDAATRLGRWVRATRTLELSRALVLERPWPEVHQRARARDGAPVRRRGPRRPRRDRAWRDVPPGLRRARHRRACRRCTDAPAESDRATDRVLERIRKLLALAGSSNQHEAELAMKQAHELMLRHNIERRRRPASYEVRHLGDPRSARTRVEADDRGAPRRVLLRQGDPRCRSTCRDARQARRGLRDRAARAPTSRWRAHVYAFLLATAERLWRENRATQRVRSGRDRLAYQSGVIRGFRDKLRGERVELRGTGLVWVGDADLDRFYRARHPRITHAPPHASASTARMPPVARPAARSCCTSRSRVARRARRVSSASSPRVGIDVRASAGHGQLRRGISRSSRGHLSCSVGATMAEMVSRTTDAPVPLGDYVPTADSVIVMSGITWEGFESLLALRGERSRPEAGVPRRSGGADDDLVRARDDQVKCRTPRRSLL